MALGMRFEGGASYSHEPPFSYTPNSPTSSTTPSYPPNRKDVRPWQSFLLSNEPQNIQRTASLTSLSKQVAGSLIGSKTLMVRVRGATRAAKTRWRLLQVYRRSPMNLCSHRGNGGSGGSYDHTNHYGFGGELNCGSSSSVGHKLREGLFGRSLANRGIAADHCSLESQTALVPLMFSRS